jgi:hypothetical protein
MALSTSSYSVSIDDNKVYVTIGAEHLKYDVISDDSPTNNRLYIVAAGATIIATPLHLIIEVNDRPARYVENENIACLNQSIFETKDGYTVMFDVPNLYHVDSAMSKILVSSSYTEKYESRQVKMMKDSCKFYAASGATFQVIHNGKAWTGLKINDVYHELADK